VPQFLQCACGLAKMAADDLKENVNNERLTLLDSRVLIWMDELKDDVRAAQPKDLHAAIGPSTPKQLTPNAFILQARDAVKGVNWNNNTESVEGYSQVRHF